MHIRLTVATALALSLAACGSQEDAVAPADDAVEQAEAAGQALDLNSPQGFIDMAASSDMYEIEAGKLAQQMGTSAAVKEFGAMMEKDHTASSDMYEIEAGKLAQQMGTSAAVKEFGAMMEKDHAASSEKLKAAAADANQGLSVPTAMQPKHQQQLDALRGAGANFDTLYAQQQQAAHQEALNLLNSQAQAGTVASLKAFAAEAQPVVQGHLEHARELGEAE